MKKIFLIILSTIFSLAVVEFGVRVFDFKSNSLNAFTGHPYKHEFYSYINQGMESNANYKFKHKDNNGLEYKIHYTTNNVGLRLPFDLFYDTKIKKKKNQKNIIILGGSTIFGVGADDKKTISSFLEVNLNAESQIYNYKVYNLGVGAANAVQGLILLNLYGHVFKPDLILSFDGFNDGVNSFIHGYGATNFNGFNHQKFYINNYLYKMPEPVFFRSKLLNFLIKNSKFFQIIFNTYHIDYKLLSNNEVPFLEGKKSLEFYEIVMEKICNLYEIKCLIAIQSNLDVNKENFDNQKSENFYLENKDKTNKTINHENWKRWWFFNLKRAMSNLSKNSQKIFFIDLNDSLNGKKIEYLNSLYIGTNHLSHKGNQVIANILKNKILKEIEPQM